MPVATRESDYHPATAKERLRTIRNLDIESYKVGDLPGAEATLEEQVERYREQPNPLDGLENHPVSRHQGVFVLDEHVVDPRDPGVGQIVVVHGEMPLHHRLTERSVHVVVEVGTGRNDAVDEQSSPLDDSSKDPRGRIARRD